MTGENGLSEEDLGVNESPEKMSENYYRMSGSESWEHNSKAWSKDYQLNNIIIIIIKY